MTLNNILFYFLTIHYNINPPFNKIIKMVMAVFFLQHRVVTANTTAIPIETFEMIVS